MNRAVAIVWILLLVMVSTAILGVGDEIVLYDGAKAYGTVTRIVPGDRVEMLQMDSEAGVATLLEFDLDSIAEIGIVEISQIPTTLSLRSGDLFRGRLMGSPLDTLIEFRAESGKTYFFEADAVDEVRLSLRPPEMLSQEEVSEEIEGLQPGIGLGCSVSSISFGVTRDALAQFNQDWMLIAALGMHFSWENPDRWDIGTSSDLTYLRRFGTWYAGLGTGVFFNMTDVAWYPTINLRVLIPLRLGEWQSTLSLGFAFHMQSD